ncbi:MOSC domain-containing protein [Aspergillus stella-maris]|uniref:MOSC domain-containing protein n=1 Tax=Aspergillus stella-maris TaxID=1810926 RepID=UPI003CCCE5F9
MATRVLSVSSSASHNFSKPTTPSIKLIANHGIEGDCHAGKTVQHLSRLHINPPPTNLRQVHLMPIEILHKVSSGLSASGQASLLKAGALGQNITTEGIDLLNMSTGTELHFVSPATKDGDTTGPILVLTGLRNPCSQIDKFQSGLQERLVVRDAHRTITDRLAGVMSIVKQGGVVKPGMRIDVVKPAKHAPLGVV